MTIMVSTIVNTDRDMVRKAGKHQRLAARMLKYLSRDTRRCTAVLYQRSDNSLASFPRLGIPGFSVKYGRK